VKRTGYPYQDSWLVPIVQYAVLCLLLLLVIVAYSLRTWVVVVP